MISLSPWLLSGLAIGWSLGCWATGHFSEVDADLIVLFVAGAAVLALNQRERGG